MNKTNKPRIANWLRRLVLVNTLLPSLLILAGLLLAALLGNHWLYEQHAHSLRENALSELRETARHRAHLIEERLARISDDVASFARHTGLALERPSRRRLDLYKKLARTPEGALYSTGKSGFAFFYSGIKPVGPGEIEKLQRLLRVDPAMAGLLHRNPGAIEVFFNTHDSLSLTYPNIDPLSRFAPGIDITTQTNYSVADTTSNPKRNPVWVSKQAESGEGDWQATCMAPVLREDSLEGVAGMTIDIVAAVDSAVGSGTSPGNTLVLLAADGTRIGTRSSPDRDAANDPAVKEHSTTKGAAQAGKPSLRTPETDSPWLSLVLDSDFGAQAIDWKGEHLAGWATIPQTGWKLLTLTPTSEVMADAAQPHATIRRTVLGSALGLVLLLLLGSWFATVRSRRAAVRLTTPLEEIARMANQTGDGKYLHRLPPGWFEEQHLAGEALLRLGEKLQGDLQDHTRTEIGLRRSGEALEQRLSELSSELKVETHKRKRLEKARAPVAGYDAVTGLPNPRLFVDRAHQALALAKRHGESITLVLIGLYEFKSDNGSEETHSFDELHREVATRLQACLRDCDTIARLSQDEFVILLFDQDATSDPEGTAQRIIERLGSAREATDQGAVVCGSIGISHYPEDGERVEELLHQADNDLVQRKEADRHCFQVGIPGTEG